MGLHKAGSPAGETEGRAFSKNAQGPPAASLETPGLCSCPRAAPFQKWRSPRRKRGQGLSRLQGHLRGVGLLLGQGKPLVQALFLQAGNHLGERLQVALHSVSLQVFVVGEAVLFLDVHRLKPGEQQLVVHDHPGGPAVAVLKGMDADKLSVGPGRQLYGVQVRLVG